MAIYVYGAGGHGKVVADILLSAGVGDVAGFVDDDECRWGSEVLGLPVRGGGEWLRREAANAPVAVALGIGENAVRQSVAERCRAWGLELVTPLHPSATVARSARLGAGTVVMAGARINPDAFVGEGVIVNTGAVVEHDTFVGDYAHLSPNAAMGGASRLGSRAHLGLGAVILPGIEVGDGAVIGAGAVVARDVPEGVVAFGVPARVRRRLPDNQG
ncbi:MAG: hypothetical protein QOH49_3892 [Acidobacteriota bacterium]|jgi:sugar O-acyltransferase (sialic acid O-acetyltransferase NeuD family)|nr:hypothetical protein [Acidobacteriota bacterium]